MAERNTLPGRVLKEDIVLLPSWLSVCGDHVDKYGGAVSKRFLSPVLSPAPSTFKWEEKKFYLFKELLLWIFYFSSLNKSFANVL